ncbi:hypothetical protein H0W26_02615 [Candidatus Dependentiae bacterium]|nr:hypothetical protein [Candidatus Dependentiae bacterium]
MTKRFYAVTARFLLILPLVMGTVPYLTGSEVKSQDQQQVFPCSFNLSLEETKTNDAALFLTTMGQVLPSEIIQTILRVHLELLLDHVRKQQLTGQPPENLDLWLWHGIRNEVLSLIELDPLFFPLVMEELGTLFKETYSLLHLAADLSTFPPAYRLVEKLCKKASSAVLNKVVLGENPLIAAISNNSFIATKSIIEAGALVNPLETKRSPLLHSIRAEDYLLTVYLLQKYADVNEQTKGTKNTPLHKAIYTKNYWLQSLLLDYGANPEIINNNKQTPLLSTIEIADSTATKILLERWANPNCKNSLGDSAIAIAGKALVQAALLKKMMLRKLTTPSAPYLMSLEEAEIRYEELKKIFQLFVECPHIAIESITIEESLKKHSADLNDHSLTVLVNSIEERKKKNQQKCPSPKKGPAKTSRKGPY